jgi:hypothetical protein
VLVVALMHSLLLADGPIFTGPFRNGVSLIADCGDFQVLDYELNWSAANS